MMLMLLPSGIQDETEKLVLEKTGELAKTWCEVWLLEDVYSRPPLALFSSSPGYPPAFLLFSQRF